MKIKDLNLDLEISEGETIVATSNGFEGQVITSLGTGWFTTKSIRYSATVYQAGPKGGMIVKSQGQQVSGYIIVVQACPDNNFAWENVGVMGCSSQCILERTLTVPILPNRYYRIPGDVGGYTFYE